MSLAVPLTHLTELAACEAGLADDLASRDAEWSTAPSALPGWTRGHVVAHLVGNAEGLRHLVTWAATGTETPMYASADARSAEIERRAALPWPELVAEQQRQAGGLGAALRGLTEPVAERDLRLGSGAPANVCDLAAVRIREIEIHRVDLAGDYHASGWSTGFTLRTFSQVTPFFRSRRTVPVQVLRATDTGNCWVVGEQGPDLVAREADLLAWLLGRPHDGVSSTTGGPIPEAPSWV